MAQPTPPPEEADQSREDTGSWLDEGGDEPPPERPATPRRGPIRWAGAGLTVWLALVVALLVALALLWVGGEMHYNNCLKRTELLSPDTTGLSVLTRQKDVANCNRSPF